MNPSLLTFSRRLTLSLLLAGAGCQMPPQPTGAGGAVTVAIRPAFGTQATTTDVDHYAVGLIDTGSNAVVFRKTNVANTLSSTTFSQVPPGSYRAFVEAFATPGDSYNIAEGKSSNSTTVATVAETGAGATQNLTVNLKLIDAGRLAGDDGGLAMQVHGYTTSKFAVTSQWVWIPPFRAYQLKNATACGGHVRFTIADNARPNGYWVGSRPSAGVPGQDWEAYTLGGFYAGKYEASREDATSSSAGNVDNLTVQPNVWPWHSISLRDAHYQCRSYSPDCYLMGDEEWTALAVWSQIHNLTVKGNTNNSPTTPNDNEGAGAACTPVTGGSGVAQTGTGGTATSHDGTSAGVYDLKGNLGEWSATLSSGAGPNWMVKDMPTGVSMPGSNLIGSLHALRRHLSLAGVPGATDATGKAEFGYDGFVQASTLGRRSVRGGNYTMNNAQAGIWHLSMDHPANDAQVHIGFRPILRF